MNLTFCGPLQRISGFFYLYSNTLKISIKEKNDGPRDFIATGILLGKKGNFKWLYQRKLNKKWL